MFPIVQHISLWIITWPYYWTFRNYTLDPIKRIAIEGPNSPQLPPKIESFKAGKRHELMFIYAANTLSAAATVGVFSWPSVAETIWPAKALWYCSLLLAIFALITSAQHSALIDSHHTFSAGNSTGEALLSALGLVLFCTIIPKPIIQCSKDMERQEVIEEACTPNWHMVYIWQCPLMLMAWSWVLFLIAETLHVARPFLPEPGGPDSRKVAITYLIMCVVVVINFAWCSFWFYRAAGRYA